MKKNLDVHFSSNSSEWETPWDLYRKLDKKYKFTLDPCATKDNAKCVKFYTKEDNGLSKDWSKDVVFMNPPYGKELTLWVEKAYNEYLKGATVVILMPARTDTSYFHKYICGVGKIKFLRGRIKFLKDGISLNSAPFPSMLVEFKPDIWKKIRNYLVNLKICSIFVKK